MADDHRDRRPKAPPAPVVLDQVRQLKQEVLTSGHYDVRLWEMVVDDLCQLFRTDDTVAALEEALSVLPSAARLWLWYVDLEMGPAGTHDAARVLFGRCLLTCPNPDLYQKYLRFIKRSNEGKGAAGCLELRAAYEFSLDMVGQDIGAGPLWQEYISFLLAPKPGSETFALLFPGALEGQEEAARTPVVRRVYQRAVVVPCSHSEALWRAYETWEVKVDRQLGRKVLDEWRPRYHAARNVLRERRARLERLILDALPLPPGKGGLPQIDQAALWNQYVDWEASNPQHLEPDSPALLSRINLAYGQCAAVMWFFPEMWHQYARSQQSLVGPDAALAVLGRAQTALPGCSLLRFTAAELQETAGQVEGAQKVFEAMIEALEKECPGAPPPPEPGSDAADPPAAPEGEPSPFGGEQGVLIWLQFIRFLRRTADTGTARQMFLRARRWQQSSVALAPMPGPNAAVEPERAGARKPSGGQLYVGMARLEWSMDHSSPAVACRIFELGLEDPRLSREPSYINAYSAFLCEIGDLDNARALYERMLAEPDAQAQAEVWRAYVVLEQAHGNLGAAQQVEARMKAALAAAAEANVRVPGTGAPPLHPSTAALQVALCKFSEGGTMPCDAGTLPHLRTVAGLAAPPPLEPVGAPARYPPGGFARGPPPPDLDREWGPPPRAADWDRAPELPPAADDRLRPPPLEEPPPDMLDLLLSQLPPPMAVDGPHVPVEAVMDVVMFADMSGPTVERVCKELEAGLLPSGEEVGVAVPQVLGMAAGTRPPPGPEHDHGPGAPPYRPPTPPYDGGYDRGAPGPRDPYLYEPPPGGPIPMTRKRRWDGPPDGMGPPPPYDYDGPPPPYDDPYAPYPAPYPYDDRRGPPPQRP